MASPKTTSELDSVTLETGLLSTWQDEKLFELSVDNRVDGEPFIFLEGPPTANGKPGIHHVVARTYKDLVCRWKTMQGNFVERNLPFNHTDFLYSAFPIFPMEHPQYLLTIIRMISRGGGIVVGGGFPLL